MVSGRPLGFFVYGPNSRNRGKNPKSSGKHNGDWGIWLLCRGKQAVCQVFTMFRGWGLLCSSGPEVLELRKYAWDSGTSV